MNVKEAVKTLTIALEADEGLRLGYQANIAMAFKDEYKRKQVEKSDINDFDIHEIANKAADNFLKEWCKNAKQNI